MDGGHGYLPRCAASVLAADLWEVLLVGFLAYLAFESVKILIDRKIEEEGGIEEAELGLFIEHTWRGRACRLAVNRCNAGV